MISHVVAVALRDDVDLAELAAVMQGLDDLRSVHPGFLAFIHGPNIDVEHLSQPFDYGFICSFADRQALDAYAADPAHKILGARLISLCRPSAGNIMVFDLQTEGTQP